MNEQQDSGKSLGAEEKAAGTRKGWGLIAEGLMWLSGVAIGAMTLLTCSDVASRYLFNAPIKGTIELVELFLVITAFSAVVYVTSKGANIEVAFVTERFPKRVQRILAAVFTCIAIVLFALVTWQLVVSGVGWMHGNRSTGTLFIPYAPFKFAAALATGCVSLILLVNLVRSLRKRS